MITEEFAQWLQTELKKRGLTQAELARRAKISRGALNNVLNGARRPGPHLCSAIAEALNMPPEAVFRKANLLPGKPETNERIDELLRIVAKLSPDDQIRVLALAKALRDVQADLEERERRSASAFQEG